MPPRSSFFKQCDVEWSCHKHRGVDWRAVATAVGSGGILIPFIHQPAIWHSWIAPAPLNKNLYRHKVNLWLIGCICLEAKLVYQTHLQWGGNPDLGLELQRRLWWLTLSEHVIVQLLLKMLQKFQNTPTCHPPNAGTDNRYANATLAVTFSGVDTLF